MKWRRSSGVALLFSCSQRLALSVSSIPRSALSSRDLNGVADVIARGARCVVLLGAGASTSAGLPDFRSPGTGLYEKLQRFDLPSPESVFDIEVFRSNPEPFYEVSRSLWPGQHAPTPMHLFVRLLNDKGQLIRCYTQNIDSLESSAGLPVEKIVAAHGNFDTATCLDTGVKVDVTEVKDALLSDDPPAAMRRLNAAYGGLIKSDIVFFGENLPEKFFRCVYRDLPSAELLLVVGTSLQVYPFASLIHMVSPATPRCLINRERVGEHAFAHNGCLVSGFDFADHAANPRDVLHKGDSDAAALLLADLLRWRSELDRLIESTRRISS